MHISYSFVLSLPPKPQNKILKKNFVDSNQWLKKELANYPNIFSKLFLVLLLLFLTMPLKAQDNWIEATGLYYGSNVTPAEGWKLSLDDARSEAIKQVVGLEVRQETFGSSYEKMGMIDKSEYGEMFSILSKSSTSGRIVKEEIIEKNGGWENNNPVYRIKIRVVVEKEVGSKDPNFQSELILDRDVYYDRGDYYKNDEIKIDFWANQDCYIYLFNFMSNDSVQLIIPNKYISDNFYVTFDNGKALKDKIKSFLKFRVRVPTGQLAVSEALYFVALKQKIDFTSKNFSTDDRDVIPTYKAAFIDLQSWLIQIPLNLRSETSKIFEIRKFE
jgi:hypothetical protein